MINVNEARERTLKGKEVRRGKLLEKIEEGIIGESDAGRNSYSTCMIYVEPEAEEYARRGLVEAGFTIEEEEREYRGAGGVLTTQRYWKVSW